MAPPPPRLQHCPGVTPNSPPTTRPPLLVLAPTPTLALAGWDFGGSLHSLALLAPMGPHLRSLRVTWRVPAGDLALMAGALPGLVELSLIE
jgi:hypothetical protein